MTKIGDWRIYFNRTGHPPTETGAGDGVHHALDTAPTPTHHPLDDHRPLKNYTLAIGRFSVTVRNRKLDRPATVVHATTLSTPVLPNVPITPKNHDFFDDFDVNTFIDGSGSGRAPINSTTPSSQFVPGTTFKDIDNAFDVMRKNAKKIPASIDVLKLRGGAGKTMPSAADPRIKAIAERFANARNKIEALKASHDAIRFYTTNSNPINLPLREGQVSTTLQTFKDAINYGIQHAPDYGTLRTVYRRVNLDESEIERIRQDGNLVDPAFTSTTAGEQDPNVKHSRNTLMIIQASCAADVAHLSTDPRMKEHLLVSNSNLTLTDSPSEEIESQDSDESDDSFFPSVRWTLRLTQAPPPPEDSVLDPWKKETPAGPS